MYQRRGIWFSFAAKQDMDDDAPIFTLKREFRIDEKLVDMVDDIDRRLKAARTGELSATDKEVNLLLHLPAPILRLSVKAATLLNEWNLLPHGMIEIDPLFSSAFLANMGSISVDAVHHHLYEYGNCPLFLAMGPVQKKMVVPRRGQPEVQNVFEVKITIDERIEDGFYCAAGIKHMHHLLEDAPEELL
jgi:hypothetical protein